MAKVILLLALASVANVTLAISDFGAAEAGWKRRGETCWRTNRHTHARFRIC